MKEYPIRELKVSEFPPLLREIPQPAKSLRLRGVLPSPELKLLSVVGSRHYTTYGQQVAATLLGGLRGFTVGIVSGLAIGIDGLAHEAALENSLYTLAIPGSGLSEEVLYPATHKKLATRILKSNGGLMSEYDDDLRAAPWTFPQRNRLVAGISSATLLIEGAEKSGTLITARMCTDYNRELLVVPGSIFSKNSVGVHQFLKLGATPVTTAADIIDVLNLEKAAGPQLSITLSVDEQVIVSLLTSPTSQDEIIRALPFPAAQTTALLMSMVLKGILHENQGVYWTII